MPCVYRGRRIVLVESHESPGWGAAPPDDQDLYRLDCMDAGERQHLGDGITRAQVMEYLSQTYGTVFVADLAKHLS